MMMSLRTDDGLRGRVAVITGAGRGIGRGAALGVARRGGRVAAIDVGDELDTTVRLVRDEDGEILPIRADLRRPDEIDRALAEVHRHWGAPDILVNNAAVLYLRPFEQTDAQVWEDTLRVNLIAAYYLTWRIYPAVVGRGRGNVIAMSSNAGVRPFALETAYCATKFAIEGLFRSLALEATAHGVIVTLGTPGAKTKPTSMTDAAFAALPDEERRRYVGPEAFAEAFGYLAGAADRALAGHRFDLYALSELIRERGWDIPAWLAVQRASRDGP
jgi:3-oxoacyl-[acyl-carrier protein] reductase